MNAIINKAFTAMNIIRLITVNTYLLWDMDGDWIASKLAMTGVVLGIIREPHLHAGFYGGGGGGYYEVPV